MIKCHRCKALYNPGNWMRVYDLATGTEPSRYVKMKDIDPTHCPICDQPPLLEKPSQQNYAM